MAANLELDASQINELVNKLLQNQNGSGLLDRLGQIMVADTQFNFLGQKSPDGIPWKGIKRKGQILRDTSRLRNSITYDVANNTSVRIGTNVEYGRLHQFGFKGTVQVAAHARLITQAFGKKLKFPVYQSVGAHTKYMNVAARPYMGFGPRAIRKIDKAVKQYGDELIE